MPNLEGPQNLQLVLLFIVPGLIAVFIRSRFIAGRPPSLGENTLAFFFLSIVYYSVAIVLLPEITSESGVVRWLYWVALVLFGPALFGLVLGIAAQKEWAAWLASKIGLEIVHIIPTAWDWRFAKIRRGGVTNHVNPNSVPVLGFGPDSVTWEDGLVIRCRTSESPLDLSRRLESGLAKFEARMIHDAKGDFVESPTGGPMSRYFEQLWNGEHQESQRRGQSRAVPLSQIFILNDTAEARYATSVEQIRAALREQCLPVFHFRDGLILLLNSRESAQITERRVTRLLKGLEWWAITDNDGASYTRSGWDESLWKPTELTELQYGDPE